MKKLFILSLFIANYTFGQSVTIVPSNATNTESVKIKKSGRGFDHTSAEGTISIGTWVGNGLAQIQTHSNHSLNFAAGDANSMMTLATSGNLGIGHNAPTQKLHVAGNGYFSGNLDSDGLITAGTLSIGGGSTISKFNEILLTGQQITGVVNNTCSLSYYSVTGVDSGSTVILNMESAFSTLTVANVRASGLNQVEVKFCNIGASNTNLLTGLNMRFTIIK